MSKFRLFPQLLIVLALLIGQQFATAHAISHTHAQLESAHQDGQLSDEAHCDTCHALGGITMFVVGDAHTAFIPQYVDVAHAGLLALSRDLATSVNFQSRAPPSHHA